MLAVVRAHADREALSGRSIVHPEHVRLVAEQLQVHELGLLHELQGMLMVVPTEPLIEQRLRQLWAQAGCAFLITIVGPHMLDVLMIMPTSPCRLSSEQCKGQR